MLNGGPPTVDEVQKGLQRMHHLSCALSAVLDPEALMAWAAEHPALDFC
jgi:hypothetical protein